MKLMCHALLPPQGDPFDRTRTSFPRKGSTVEATGVSKERGPIGKVGRRLIVKKGLVIGSTAGFGVR